LQFGSLSASVAEIDALSTGHTVTICCSGGTFANDAEGSVATKASHIEIWRRMVLEVALCGNATIPYAAKSSGGMS
jgi:hypothetical protein